MCLQFQTSTSTCHHHSHVSQMPQRCLARDSSDPAFLVRLVSKPHHPVSAQQKLRWFLLWRGVGGRLYMINGAHRGPSTQNTVGMVLLASAIVEGAVCLTRLGVVLPASLFLSHQTHSVSSWPRSLSSVHLSHYP